MSFEVGWQTYIFSPFDQRIVHPRVKHCPQAVLVVSQNLHGELAGGPERALHARDAEPIDNVLGQSERHAFRDSKFLALWSGQNWSF